MKKNTKSQSGFTLLEMTIVVIVSGMLLAFLGATLLAFMNKSKVRTTEYRMQKISESISHYLSVNAHYPCPASRFLGAQQSTYGKEVTATCTNTGVTNGTSITAANGVRIGAVPTRTLNMPDEFMSDGWGNKFTFAMTARLATNLLYAADSGRVQIRDGNNNLIGTTFHYIIVSHGASGDGAFPSYSINGNTPPNPCPANSMDTENCDDDAVFRLMLVNNELNLANFYDDYFYYKGVDKTAVIPAGAVAPFNLTTCPAGWTDFRAGEAAFIVGAQAAAIVEPADIITNSGGNSSIALPLLAQDSNGNPQVTLPPYRALKYCERLPQ